MKRAIKHRNEACSEASITGRLTIRKRFFLIFFLFFLSACGRLNLWDNEYLSNGSTTIVLPDVTMITLTSGTNSITAEWEDPVIDDMDRVEVTCTTVAGITEVLPTVQTCTIDGLAASQDYTVTLVVVDINENRSAGISFTINTSNKEGHFIYTADDLNAVRGGVTGYTDWTLDDTYYLMADIDLTGYGDWTSIGDSAVNSFSGVFEGNNHIISNLTINASANYQGLFGYLDGGEVQNLSLTNVSIAITGASSFYSTGSLAGYCSGNITNISANGTIQNTSSLSQNIGGLVGEFTGNISNCTVSVNVTGFNIMGGLAGAVYSGSVITNSHSTGSVSGQNTIGGLVGNNQGSITGAIGTECYSTGAVTATTSRAGGLVGMNTGGAITYCYHTTGLVKGGERIGGLIGSNLSGGVITHCYSTGLVQGTGDNVGGLIGLSSGGSLSSCTSSGNVEATGSNVGGLIGTNSGGSVLACEAGVTGSIVSDASSNIGGLIGNNTGSVQDSTAHSNIVLNHEMSSYTFIGGLIGDSTGSLINCHSFGDIQLENYHVDYIGGLVGRFRGSSLTGCTASGYLGIIADGITGTDKINVGGFIGVVETSGADMQITASQASGNVNVILTADTGTTTVDSHVGGFIGITSESTNTVEIFKSKSSGNVYISFSGSTGTKNVHAGGFIGLNIGCTIQYCFYSTGSVDASDGTATSARTGGFIGENSGIITDSYSTGNVSGITLTGGFAGYLETGSEIRRCYATGAVSNVPVYGGMLGFNNGGVTAIDTASCFFDISTTLCDNSGSDGTVAGTAASHDDMIDDILPNIFTMNGWDFVGETSNGSDDYWAMDPVHVDNNGYPYLTNNPPI